jgi:hypothetical protein
MIIIIVVMMVMMAAGDNASQLESYISASVCHVLACGVGCQLVWCLGVMLKHMPGASPGNEVGCMHVYLVLDQLADGLGMQNW